MGKKMVLDEARALRREQREARIARKRERREARALKRQHHTMAVETPALESGARCATTNEQQTAAAEPVAVEVAARAAVPPPAADPEAVPETAACKPESGPVAAAAEKSVASPHRPVPNSIAEIDAPPARSARPAMREAPRTVRRERDIAEFLKRRDERLGMARAEAKERIALSGEEEAVCDALGALAHPQASPWHRHRERLADALATGRIPEIGAAARRGCRGAAADAARTSRRAPNADEAHAVAVAYAVIARTPWAAIRGRRAERSTPTRQPPARPFWH
jgi:hypothetical protein